jgi:hypothetical protein
VITCPDGIAAALAALLLCSPLQAQAYSTSSSKRIEAGSRGSRSSASQRRSRASAASSKARWG